jgi:hypothetical protein
MKMAAVILIRARRAVVIQIANMLCSPSKRFFSFPMVLLYYTRSSLSPSMWCSTPLPRGIKGIDVKDHNEVLPGVAKGL